MTEFELVWGNNTKLCYSSEELFCSIVEETYRQTILNPSREVFEKARLAMEFCENENGYRYEDEDFEVFLVRRGLN